MDLYLKDPCFLDVEPIDYAEVVVPGPPCHSLLLPGMGENNEVGPGKTPEVFAHYVKERFAEYSPPNGFKLRHMPEADINLVY